MRTKAALPGAASIVSLKRSSEGLRRRSTREYSSGVMKDCADRERPAIKERDRPRRTFHDRETKAQDGFKRARVFA